MESIPATQPEKSGIAEIRKRTPISRDDEQSYFCMTLQGFTKADGSPIRFYFQEEGKKWMAGTSSRCEIRLKEYGVSSEHCTFEKIKSFLLINDLGSEKGVMINGVRLLKSASAFLRSGDELRLGNLTFSIEDEKSQKERESRQEEELVPPPIPRELIQEAKVVGSSPLPSPSLVEDKILNHAVSKQEISTSSERPTIFHHNLALFVDLGLTYLLVRQFAKSEGHQKILEFFQIVINGGLSMMKNPLEIDKGSVAFTAISFFLFWLAYSLTTTLFLGVTLGQKVCNLKAKDSFLWNRVGGVVRILFSLFTTPFLVFDFIPHLLRKRSLKEKLSMTTLVVGNIRWVPLTLLLLVIPFILLIIATPFWTNRHYNLNREIVRYQESIPPVDLESVVGNEVKLIKSHYFRFSFDHVNSKDFIIFPGFDLSKKGVFQRINPTINFYDVKNETMGKFVAEKHIYIADDLLLARSKIEKFSFHYPALDLYLKENQKIIDRFQGKFDQAPFPPMSIEAKKDYVRLVYKSITFSPQRWKNYFEKGEFFLSGYGWFQKVLAKRYVPFEKYEQLNLQLITLSGENFLLISKENKFELKANSTISRYLFPLGTMNGILYKMAFAETPHYEKSFLTFLSYFSYQLKWHFDEENILNLKENLMEMKLENPSLFDIVDYFSVKDIRNENRMKLEDALFINYIELGRKSVILKNRDFSSGLADELAEAEVVTKLMVKDLGQHEKFLHDLKGLERAIRDQDEIYFKNFDESRSILLRDQEIDELIPSP